MRLSAFNKNDADRHDFFKLRHHNIEIDFSHQKVNHKTIQLLINLANERNIKEKITSLVSGGIVNKSQKIPALHTALRVNETWVNISE